MGLFVFYFLYLHKFDLEGIIPKISGYFVVPHFSQRECFSPFLAEVEAHVDLLAELLPDWISKADIKGAGEYVRIKTEVPVAKLLGKLDICK